MQDCTLARRLKQLIGGAGAAIVLVVGAVGTAAQAAPASCAKFAPPMQRVAGHTVGITQCDIISETKVADSHGRPFVRVEIAISGSVYGFIPPATVGVTRLDVTDYPQALYTQYGITNWVGGVSKYNGGVDDKGAGLTLIYPDPASGTPWNGKVYFVVHGTSNNPPLGELVPVGKDGFTEKTFANHYARLMMDKGYAVIYPRRPGSIYKAILKATLDDGKNTVIDNSINDHIGMQLDFYKIGKAMITERLGKAPTASYWYGHSSGTTIGRLINYFGGNWDENGKRYFDGFFSDDPGGGSMVPVLLGKDEVFGEKDGRVTYNPADVLFGTPDAKAKFTKEITISHGAYLATHDWIPTVLYTTLKRQTALILHERGLDDRAVMYEVADVSHIPNTVGSPEKTLDLGPLADKVIDLLDDWVQHDVAPPPTIADLAAVGVGGSYAAEHTQSLELPPIACPTGARYFYPPPGGGPTATGYAAFDGKSLEPVNSRGSLVDVNGNSYRDTMPTIDQAWVDRGLILAGQKVDASKYAACIESSTRSLVEKRLISQASADWYKAQARKYPNVPW
jgi:hypothetical protein